MQELSRPNFTYLVLATVALFELSVFRSVSVRFTMFFVQRKVCEFFQKVSKLYYSVINLTCLKSALAIFILLVFVESYDVHFWVEELSNFTYMARTGRVFRAKVGKFGCNRRAMQHTQFLQPNGGASFASP